MDKITKEKRSENMRRIRSKDTIPELAVRRLIYSMEYRYRLHEKYLPGKLDLVFKGKKKAIFVHGCFWHQHEGCIDAHIPKSNFSYWGHKLRKNIERDTLNQKELSNIGWQYLVIWECQTKNLEEIRNSILRFLD